MWASAVSSAERVWGFTGFEVANYLIFREKVPRVCGKKFFGGGRVWGVGCGVWGFTGFEVANYLIFREKVPEFSP